MLGNVILVSNSLCDVRNWQGSRMRHYGHAVREIRAIKARFTRIEFVHERRGSNVDTDRLAKGKIYKYAVCMSVFYLHPVEFVVLTSYLINMG